MKKNQIREGNLILFYKIEGLHDFKWVNYVYNSEKMKVKMDIPDSEKKFLTDCKFEIPEIRVLRKWNRGVLPLRVAFYVKNGHISRLALRGLNLTELPDSIGNLKELRILLLYSNHLKNLPESFQNLTNLEELELSRNDFTSLPDWFGNFKNLLKLYLGRNQFQSLPDCVGNLTNLEELGLSDNNFTSLPDSMGNLKNLRNLSLSNCGLHSLPDWFGALINLENVELDGNKISVLPESFRNLKNLKNIGLEDAGLRSFSNIPVEFEDQIDAYEDSWPWPAFFSEGNYPSPHAKEHFKNTRPIVYEFWPYYRVSPLELAAKYAQDQNSLYPQEKDRLAWEGGFRERQLMEEGGVAPDDPILAEINKHLTITCDNGLKLIK